MTTPNPFGQVLAPPDPDETLRIGLEAYYSYLLSKCSDFRMQEVVKAQQKLADPDLSREYRRRLKLVAAVAHKAYTDPFGAKILRGAA